MILNHIGPIIGTLCYLLYPINLRINQTLLYNISIIHNVLLMSFSAWTFISLLNILYKYGIVFESNYYFKDLFFNKIIYYFYLSKYYEYIDTFLLYLNDKKPIFLQKFHHVGAVIVWYLAYNYKVDAIWLGTISNSFIHTIMYSYYLGSLLKIKNIKFIKQYITTLQLIQLIVPSLIDLYFYRPPIETVFNYYIINIFVLYVTILIILFGVFYYKNYIKIK
jgi:hypothetical protein